jgi:DNA end-binding protein Ku
MPESVRSFWKGHLRLALVTIPIRLVSATSSEGGVHFHQVDRKSRQRIRYLKVAAESGEKVEQSDIVRGFEFEPGNYVLLQDEDLDALRLETRHTVELLEFVNPADIDPLYYEKPYFVLPDGEVAEEGYSVIRDALRETRRSGIGQLTLRGREHLVSLTPSGAGLVLTTLRYESELKNADRVFSGIGTAKLKPALVDMAKRLILEREATFDAAKYRDHYAEALRELVQAKVEGGKSVAVSGGDTSAPTGTVIDFMAALKASVSQSGKRPKVAATATGAAAPVKKGGKPKSSRKAK